MPVWVFKIVNCQNELQESSLCAVAETTKGLSSFIRKLEDKWKIKGTKITQALSSQFYWCAVACALQGLVCGTARSKQMEQIRVFPVSFSELRKCDKNQSQVADGGEPCVLVSYASEYTIHVKHNSVVTGMLLQILSCPFLSYFLQKYTTKRGRTYCRCPLMVYYICHHC